LETVRIELTTKSLQNSLAGLGDMHPQRDCFFQFSEYIDFTGRSGQRHKSAPAKLLQNVGTGTKFGAQSFAGCILKFLRESPPARQTATNVAIIPATPDGAGGLKIAVCTSRRSQGTEWCCAFASGVEPRTSCEVLPVCTLLQ
jgi:hypothetical protein